MWADLLAKGHKCFLLPGFIWTYMEQRQRPLSLGWPTLLVLPHREGGIYQNSIFLKCLTVSTEGFILPTPLNCWFSLPLLLRTFFLFILAGNLSVSWGPSQLFQPQCPGYRRFLLMNSFDVNPMCPGKVRNRNSPKSRNISKEIPRGVFS